MTGAECVVRLPAAVYNNRLVVLDAPAENLELAAELLAALGDGMAAMNAAGGGLGVVLPEGFSLGYVDLNEKNPAT